MELQILTSVFNIYVSKNMRFSEFMLEFAQFCENFVKKVADVDFSI